MPLRGGGQIRLAADFSHKTRAFATPANDPEQSIEYDAMVNASLAYIFPNEQWELQLWGKNLTNEHVALSTTAFGIFLIPAEEFLNGAPSYQSHYAPPLTWGATIRFRL